MVFPNLRVTTVIRTYPLKKNNLKKNSPKGSVKEVRFIADCEQMVRQVFLSTNTELFRKEVNRTDNNL